MNKTTPERAKAYIKSMPREALELLAWNILSIVALEHDEDHPEPVLTCTKEQNSCVDAMQWVSETLTESDLDLSDIEKHAELNPATPQR